MASDSDNLSKGFYLTSGLLVSAGLALMGVWAALVTDNAPLVLDFVDSYVYLGNVFSPLVAGFAMFISGIGLLSRRRFGFVTSAYTLTIWAIMSTMAIFAGSLDQVLIPALNLAVFGGALYHFLRNKHIFVQDIPEVVHAISFLMFVTGWLGLSFAVNHILYTTTLHTALVLGGSLLMMEGSVGLAARSRVGLWFSLSILLAVVVFESAFMLLEGGSGYLYRVTMSTIGIYYLYIHREIF